MVFSQTSHKTQSLLKVVELDRLKPEKSQQVNGSNGVITDGYAEAIPSSPVAATSDSEVRAGSSAGYLKPEPMYESTMFHDSDNEFFQDLGLWCSAPAKEEQVQTIDSATTEEKAHDMNTTHTPSSPQVLDAFDTNSPNTPADFYNTSPIDVDPSSPQIEGSTLFNSNFLKFPDVEENKILFPEQFLDISSLPVVIGDLASEKVADKSPWQATEPAEWTYNTHDTDYTKMYTSSQNTMPFIYQDQEDSLDFVKFVSVIPREVESNDVVISEYVINDDTVNDGVQQGTELQRRGGGLSVDVATRAPSWPNDIISTPEVLSYVVDQLDNERCPQIMKTKLWPVQETVPVPAVSCTKLEGTPHTVDYEPITPKSESQVESDTEDVKSHSSKRKRHDSEDSDKTYTPYSEQTPRKYKRRKPSVPIKDMIIALEGSQQLTKARRGRPPKRRESTVSSVCSVDENSSSMSSRHEVRYREIRDKNNEASKRSRMNRKLKELQMEQLADDLEERNKHLKVQADVLEEMTKKLKAALMTAILQK